MTPPNVNTFWARTFVDQLVANGIESVCIAPGSRSTPLVVAFAEHDRVTVYSHLDERSAGYFALGRSKLTGRPTPLVCTSGTAAANFHPAVIEADAARVPLLVLTADRPPELQDSGANQTIDQEKLYGDTVRWYRTLPEPGTDTRKLNALKTTALRATTMATQPPAGPVHLNFPFRKPLAPTVDEESTHGPPDALSQEQLAQKRQAITGTSTLSEADIDAVRTAVDTAEAGLIVAGPLTTPRTTDAVSELAAATGFPVLADPLSGLRYGTQTDAHLICGGYDAYLTPRVTSHWTTPDVVIRFGASPTSKNLREYLEQGKPRQFLVDAAGEWREATFSATDHVVADPAHFAETLATTVDPTDQQLHASLSEAEAAHWERIDSTDKKFEGRILYSVVTNAPDPSLLFVANSMPVRDLDRFGKPQTTDVTVIGNRGASGIDGNTSTALGAGSTTDAPLIAVLGDLAYYHDMNGLLAIARSNVDATIVLINNDGGGIFHMLPIEDHPTFTDHFKTPHGLDLSPTEDLYDLDFIRVPYDEFEDTYQRTVTSAGTHVLEVQSDAAESHAIRDDLQEDLISTLTT